MSVVKVPTISINLFASAYKDPEESIFAGILWKFSCKKNWIKQYLPLMIDLSFNHLSKTVLRSCSYTAMRSIIAIPTISPAKWRTHWHKEPPSFEWLVVSSGICQQKTDLLCLLWNMGGLVKNNTHNMHEKSGRRAVAEHCLRCKKENWERLQNRWKENRNSV